MELWAEITISGLLVGILVSAPMGPIGMLCIQRTLNKGRWPAFCTGLGAALSDLIYSMLTGLSLSFVTDFINAHHSVLQIIGSFIIIAYSFYLYRVKPQQALSAPNIPANTYWRDFVTGFLLTFSNPLIIFFIMTLFAQFNFLSPEFKGYHYIAGYIGLLIGAVLWWFCVTTGVDKVRSRFTAATIVKINRVLAVILTFIAVAGIAWGLIDCFI